jgi:4-amino-4-deoxy-L-arabinose transferase-like glycosyltransferase
MFGPVAGLITLTLFVLDPTVLVNAPFVTTDTGAAFGFFASVYTFYRFVKKMPWQRATVSGLAVGVALVSKHSTVLLVPILILLSAGELAGRWNAEDRWPIKTILRGIGRVAAKSLIDASPA